MSRRSYPYYDGSTQIKASSNKIVCDVTHCEEPATRRVNVQFSWFRGEDGQVRLCDAHAQKARNDVDGLCENVPQKAWK